MLSLQVLNTKGAARRLGCSETWIHKLAATGKLRAYIYGEEGELIEHEKEIRKQVRALSFLAEDLESCVASRDCKRLFQSLHSFQNPFSAQQYSAVTYDALLLRTRTSAHS
jgi:hypothetical protein